tara:strand:- start:714 stop:908 length:195 start_codon:yes stop_codon:yes gene_type:complete
MAAKVLDLMPRIYANKARELETRLEHQKETRMDLSYFEAQLDKLETADKTMMELLDEIAELCRK